MSADDNVLMERVQKGDVLAFELLMKRHRHGVMRFLAYVVSNKETAADLTQETFLRVFQKAHHYKPFGSFKTWLYRVARNLAISHLRRSALKRLVPWGDDPDKPSSLDRCVCSSKNYSPERSALNQELGAMIRKALKDMTPKLREAFLLCDVMGFSLSEMAAVTGVTTSTLKVRVFRARTSLRKALSPYVGQAAPATAEVSKSSKRVLQGQGSSGAAPPALPTAVERG
ncbi:RNA polymerase sigma factor [Acidobacteriota bacterium]